MRNKDVWFIPKPQTAKGYDKVAQHYGSTNSIMRTMFHFLYRKPHWGTINTSMDALHYSFT